MTSAFLRYLGLCTLLFLWGVPAQAATLYIDPSETEIYPGDTLSLAVRIDTDEGECVNVVDAVLTYDPEVIPVDISRGESIMPIWVEDPTIDTANHRITFAGGIPNGYCGRIAGDPRLTNVILEILVQAPAFSVGIGDRDGFAPIEFTNETAVFLNDGTGNTAPLLALGTGIHVQKRPRNEPVDEWNDRVAEDVVEPQEFSISLNSDESIYNGRYYVTFNTTDKQSGLDHYEIMEEPLDLFDLFIWGAVGAPWHEARSPYLLKDQSLNSTIRVKAIDKSGNEYIAVYVPDESMRGKSQRDYARLGIFFSGVVIILVALGSLLFDRRSVKNYEDEEEQLEQ